MKPELSCRACHRDNDPLAGVATSVEGKVDPRDELCVGCFKAFELWAHENELDVRPQPEPSITYYPAGSSVGQKVKATIVPVPEHQQFNLKAKEEVLISPPGWLVSLRDFKEGGTVAQHGDGRIFVYWPEVGTHVDFTRLEVNTAFDCWMQVGRERTR